MMGIMKELFLWVLYSSISAGVVASIFILIRIVFKNRMAPRIFCMLWLFVIIKLIIMPFAPGSQISVFNIVNYHPISSYMQDTAVNLQPFTDPSYLRGSGGNEQLNSISNHPNQTVLKNDNIYGVPESANDGGNAARPDRVSVLALVWVAGLLLTACIFICSGVAFAKGLRKAEKTPDALLPDLIHSYKRKQHVKRSIEVYSSSNITNPCVIGIVKPRIFLPQQVTELSNQQLTHILMHEIAHLKRKDYLINILIAVVNTVHWFNPILWYAMKLYNMDREVSCDAYALEILGQEETIPYGTTLLKLSKMIPKNRLQFNVSHFFKSEKQIGRRIIMIKKFKKGTYKISAAAIVLCLLLGMATLTNAAGASTVTQKDQIKAVLGNSSYMYFNSLEKVQDFSDFTYKVPDYLPVGFELYSFFLYQNKIDRNDLLEICYWSTPNGGKMVSDNEEHHFSLSVSKGNLLQNVKSNKEATYKEEKTSFNGLDATYITVYTKQQVNKKNANFVIMDTVKHLIWQDQNTWYDLEYYLSSKGKNGTPNVYENISQDDVNKIVASMKVPQDIKYADYRSEIFKNSFAIYDEAGLKDAEKLLGFTPKFPLCITDGFNISSANVGNAIYFKNDQNTPILTTRYCSTAKEEDSKTIEIEQSRLSSLYDNIVKNGYMNSWNSTTGKNEAVLSKAISIAGINLLTFDITFENKTEYVWEQNGIYYTATFSDGINQMEAIMKAFVTLNS